jgi:DNA-binding transcriptional LysR family regulator
MILFMVYMLAAKRKDTFMDLHYLELFNTIAAEESFTKASEILHISQSALSIQIKKFEQQLGFLLFNRAGNKVNLNENGKILFEYSQSIFKLIMEAEYKLLNKKEYMTGTINIGASNTPGTYMLPLVIGEFKKEYPNVNINLNIGNTSEIAHLINNGTLDFAVNGGNLSYHKEVNAIKLMDDDLVLVVSPKSEFADVAYADSLIIKKMSFVVHKTDSQLYTYYKNFIDLMNVPENVAITLSNIDAIKHAVIANVGVSLIPFVAVSLELELGLLKRIMTEPAGLKYPYSLIYNNNKYLSPPVEKFIQMIRDYINKQYLSVV